MGLSQKEAKLGAEENTFFYDEERKMWRERGAEIPAAAAPLPPPPTARPPGTSATSTGASTIPGLTWEFWHPGRRTVCLPCHSR